MPYFAPISLSIYLSIWLSLFFSGCLYFSLNFRAEETRESNEIRYRVANELISTRFRWDGTKHFLRRISRTNELSFRIVNLPRNEMKRWNDSLAPFWIVFTGAHAPSVQGLTLTSTTLRTETAPYCRTTSNNYFYGLSYKNRNEKYEHHLQSLIFFPS